MRDAGDLLEKVGIPDAYQFIEDNPHPRLWYGYHVVALFALPCTLISHHKKPKISYVGGIYRTPAMKLREFPTAGSEKFPSYFWDIFHFIFRFFLEKVW